MRTKLLVFSIIALLLVASIPAYANSHCYHRFILKSSSTNTQSSDCQLQTVFCSVDTVTTYNDYECYKCSTKRHEESSSTSHLSTYCPLH